MSYALKVREDLLRQVMSMKEGQALQVTGAVMREAFPTDPLFEPRPPEDQLLEKLPGSNYGTFRCTLNPEKQIYTISRHPEGEHKIRESWDRRHFR